MVDGNRVLVVPDPSLFPVNADMVSHLARSMNEKRPPDDAEHAALHPTPPPGPEPEFAKWRKMLLLTTAGQKLLDHISHAEAAPFMQRSSPLENAKTFQRIFMHALYKSTTCFGLPKKTPKFIAIVNLSGERLLLHSSNPHLITSLAAGARRPELCSDGVYQILSKATTDERYSVLICYSLPFQMGIDRAHWECRLLTKSATGIDDAELGCSVDVAQARKMASTRSVESQHAAILDAQEEEFARTIKACDLDVEEDATFKGINELGSAEEKVVKLQAMVTMLNQERKRMLCEHKQQISEIREKHNADKFNSTAASQEVHLKYNNELSKLESAMKEKDEIISKLQTETLLHSEDKDEVTRKLTARNSELAKEAQTLKAQLRKAETDHMDAMKRQERVYRGMNDESERKLLLSISQQADQNEAAEKIHRLQEAFDSVSNEKSVIEADLVHARSRAAVYAVRMAFQLGRRKELGEMTKTARMKHAQCADELRRCSTDLKRTKKELEATRVELKEAVQRRKESPVASVAPTPSPPPPPPAVQQTTTAMQTDILVETLQIGELETESVKLKDEITNLKMELARSKARNAKRPPPASFAPEDNNNTPAETTTPATATSTPSAPPAPPAPTSANVPSPSAPPFTPAKAGGAAPVAADGMLEATIKQLHMSLGMVVDLARQSKTNEQSSRDAWIKLHAYENMHLHGPHPNSHVPAQGMNGYAMTPYVYMPPVQAPHAPPY